MADEKKPSGHQNRERNKAARILELQAELARLGHKQLPPSESLAVSDCADLFAEIGPPPLDSPENALSWVRRYQLTAMHVAATQPLDEMLETRLKYIKDFGATVGMTQNRTSLEESAERLEGLLDAARPTGAKNTGATESAPRAPTGRGGPKGPRPVKE